jgi:hypothetical protein
LSIVLKKVGSRNFIAADGSFGIQSAERESIVRVKDSSSIKISRRPRRFQHNRSEAD